MKKKTRKILSVFVAIMMMTTLLVPVVATDSTATTTVNEIYISNVLNAGIRYFPFVYTMDDGFAWFRDNIIGTNDCCEGYLYVKDLQTGSIWQVLDEPVDFFEEYEDLLICVINEGTWVSVSLDGQGERTLYTAQNPISHSIIRDENLYFNDGNTIVCLDVISGFANNIVACERIDYLYVSEDSTTIIWTDDSAMFAVSNDPAAQIQRITGDDLVEIYAAESLGSEVLGNMESEEINGSESNILLPESLAGNRYNSDGTVKLPLSNYPNGSYYNSNYNLPCTCHANGCNSNCTCISYGGGSQCFGFARYVYDQYANKSYWSSPVAGDCGGWVGFSSSSSVRVFFASLPIASCVRLVGYKPGEATWTDEIWPDHSVVTMGTQLLEITVYECNMTGRCQVSTGTYSPNTILNRYKAVENYFTHTFNGTASYYDGSYHKLYCSSSGCTGYILQPHSVSGGYCSACGPVVLESSGDEAS